MLKKLSFLLLITTIMMSCSVKFVPTTSGTMKASVISLQTEIASVYDNMLVTPAYDNSKPAYDKIESHIDSMAATDSLRKNAGRVFKEVKLLRTAFLKYKAWHEASPYPSKYYIALWKNYLLGYVQPIMVSEMSY